LVIVDIINIFFMTRQIGTLFYKLSGTV